MMNSLTEIVKKRWNLFQASYILICEPVIPSSLQDSTLFFIAETTMQGERVILCLSVEFQHAYM